MIETCKNSTSLFLGWLRWALSGWLLVRVSFKASSDTRSPDVKQLMLKLALKSSNPISHAYPISSDESDSLSCPNPIGAAEIVSDSGRVIGFTRTSHHSGHCARREREWVGLFAQFQRPCSSNDRCDLVSNGNTFQTAS